MFFLDSLRFDEAYKILDSSFPTDELKTYPRLLSDFIFGGMKIYALGDDEKLSAVLTLWEFEDFVFVENFAVDKALRNTGLGTELLEKVISHYASKNVILEVEVPEDDVQKKRVQFYIARGFTKSGIEYTQPQLRDTPSDIKLSLMFSGETLSEESLEAYKKEIFTRVYGINEAFPP